MKTKLELNSLVRFSPLLCLAALLLASPLQADVTEVEDFDFEISDGGRLSVENINGDITITGGSGNRIQVIATKTAGNQDYLDGMKIKVSASSDRVSIRTE
ncbi:MAG: hypothetical protein R3212_12285, partial [Xanthomonadales bacterium]|nr:hypothetical protein [Xanthomonadales bacterium]